MALHKLSKPKTFHVDYCGCTAAALLLNDQTIRDAIDVIHQVKTKRDFVKTTVTISKDGVKIIYNNEPKFSTTVPATMIAGSTLGKPSLHNTVGVVYISPLTGQHYPAFVHVYRCDSSRTAQKFLLRLRAYLYPESHRLRICQLEQQLLDRNLLNIDRFNAAKAQRKSSTPTTVTANDNRKENQIDPIKSITEEFQKKIDSQEPILFPPKDYDTLHAKHGDIQRAQVWKSTEPTIVGYSPLDSGDIPTRRQIQTDSLSTIDEHKNNDTLEHSRSITPQNDPTIDPVETVSLAFDFLKDETGSIFTDTDGNIEHIDVQQHNKLPVYRFRPPQITAITKKLFTRNNNYELTNNVPQSNSSSRNNLDVHYENNNNRHHHYVQNGHRTPPEARLYSDDPQHHQQFRPHFENRLINGSGIPIATNPLWSPPSSSLVSSQPNLLSHQKTVDITPFQRQLSPERNNEISSMPLKNPLYASNPDNRSDLLSFHQKKSTPVQQQLNRKQKTQSQYLDTNEFILCASNGQPLRKTQHPNRYASKEYRPHSMNVNGTLLDVYY